MIDEKLIDKIRKLLTLANDKGAAVGEMETAMAKARELCIRHSIEMDSIDLEKGNERRSVDVQKDETLTTRSKYRQPYHSHVFNVLQEVFEVRVINITSRHLNGERIKKIVLVGEITDVLVAKEIFKWLEQLFPKSLSQQVSARRLTYSAADTNGWYHGLMVGIIETNRRAVESLSKEDAGTYAMVLQRKEDAVDEAVDKMYPNLKERRTRARQYSDFAAYYGKEKGKSINLKAVGNGTPTTALT